MSAPSYLGNQSKESTPGYASSAVVAPYASTTSGTPATPSYASVTSSTPSAPSYASASYASTPTPTTNSPRGRGQPQRANPRGRRGQNRGAHPNRGRGNPQNRGNPQKRGMTNARGCQTRGAPPIRGQNRGRAQNRGFAPRGGPNRERGNPVPNRGVISCRGKPNTNPKPKPLPPNRSQKPQTATSTPLSVSQTPVHVTSHTSIDHNDDHIDLSHYTWSLIVEKGVRISSDKKVKPYVEVELVTGELSPEEGWKNIKTGNKTKTQAVEGNDPIYQFQAVSLNCDNVWSRFNGVKVSCYSKKTLGGPDFLGEGYAWFDYEILGPDKGPTHQFDVDLSKGKKNAKYSGCITLRSNYTRDCPVPDTSTRQNISNPILSSGKSTSELKLDRAAAAMNSCDKVTVTSAGRREVRVTQSTGQVVTWSELPKIDFDKAGNTKKERNYRFNTVTALWLVNCCQLAYRKEETSKTICLNVWDMKEFTFIDDKKSDTQGFITCNEEFIIVCFRGTESAKDMMTNLNFIMVAAPHHPDRYQKNGVKVHNGFNQAMSSVWPIVEEFVHKAYQKFPNMKLLICGHSLGGALANLCYSYFVLSDNPRKVHSVYTIGQPRVGNKKLKEQLDLTSPDTVYIRITNNMDCVPSLAPGLHCGTHIQFDPNGRLVFEPPAWKKAQLKALSYQDTAASLSYGGMADHGSGKYRSLVERYWVKSEYSKMEGDSGTFCTCEKILFLIDMLQEDIKQVKKYKPQFRAITVNIVATKPILTFMEDFLANGIDAKSNLELSAAMTGYFDSLSELKGLVLGQHNKKSIIQKMGSSEKSFNKKMTGIAGKIQLNLDIIDKVLSTAQSSSTLPSYVLFCESAAHEVYDRSLYLKINFSKIDFSKLKGELVGEVHVSQLLYKAEEYLDDGNDSMALTTLQRIDTPSTDVVGVLSEEETSLVAFLEAKAYAKLGKEEECFKCLSRVKNIQPHMTADNVFQKLKNQTEFETHKQRASDSLYNSQVVASSWDSNLNNMEIGVISEIFDDADDNGDNFLTVSEIENLISNLPGGIGDLLTRLEWAQDNNAVSQKANYFQTTVIGQMQTKFNRAVTLVQFIGLFSNLK